MRVSVLIFVSFLLFPRIFLGAGVLNSTQEVSLRSREVTCLSEPNVIDRIAREVGHKGKNGVKFTEFLRLQEQKQNYAKEQGWAKRHPVAFGALLGFGAGFAIGVAVGDAADDEGFPFDDTHSWFNGIILGGIGAGVGALIGKTVSD